MTCDMILCLGLLVCGLAVFGALVWSLIDAGRVVAVLSAEANRWKQVYTLVVLDTGDTVACYMDKYHRDRTIQGGDCVYRYGDTYLIRRCE